MENTEKLTKKKTTKTTTTSPKTSTTKKATTKTESVKKKTTTGTKTTKKVTKKKVTPDPVPTKKIITQPATAKVQKKVEKKENGVNATNPVVKLPKVVTIEPKARKVPDIQRPQPKPRTFNKDEKVLYKKLDEAFTYIANMTWVIEEKTMDVKQIPDLTLGELHVIEMVNKFNNRPMSVIATNLNVTIGSLITCVNRLCRKDYLIRTRDEMDHRIINLSVTPKAKKVLKVHDKFHTDILYLALENMSLPNATKVLTTLMTTLDNYMNPKEEKKARK